MFRKSSYSMSNGQCIEVDTSWRKSSYRAYNGNCVEVNLGWEKSSYSSYNGSCVEVNLELDPAPWEKASFSFSNGNCVEVKKAASLVGVRDTKEAALGADRVTLGFSRAAWQEFTRQIKEAV